MSHALQNHPASTPCSTMATHTRPCLGTPRCTARGLNYIQADMCRRIVICDLSLRRSRPFCALRSESRQDHEKPSVWPETTYQYASYLAAFPRFRTLKLHSLASTGYYASDRPNIEDHSMQPEVDLNNHAEDSQDDAVSNTTLLWKDW